MYLLDTNIISELTKPQPNTKVVEWVMKQDELCFSVITYHEIRYGINRTKKEQKKKLETWWNEFLTFEPIFVPIDIEIANLSSVIRTKSEIKGKQICLADSLILATAIHKNKILVTRNVSDFENNGVSLLNLF